MADSSSWQQVSRGRETLRHYLAWNYHTRVTRLAPDAFAAWMEGEVLAFLCNSKASLLRVRAESIRRFHVQTLDPLVSAAEAAEEALEASDEGQRIRDATIALSRARAATAGIEHYLQQTPSGPEMRAKQNAVVAKLEAAKASLPLAEHELASATVSSELWWVRGETARQLAAAREVTGLTAAQAAASAASTTMGRALVSVGGNYEVVCRAAVLRLLQAGVLIDDLEDNDGGGGGAGAGAGGVVLMLHNVTLGATAGEMDCVVVRVNDPSLAFTYSQPCTEDGISRKRLTRSERSKARREARSPGDPVAVAAAAAAAAEDEENISSSRKPPAVEVLLVMEFKRNPDDVARGFHAKQTLLGWLAGVEYNADEWKNKRHPSGHFTRGFHRLAGRATWVAGGGVEGAEEDSEGLWGWAGGEGEGERKETHARVHVDDGNGGGGGGGGDDDEKEQEDEISRISLHPCGKGWKRRERTLIVTRESFRRFRRDEKTGFLLDGCWLATRPKPLAGMEAKVRANANPSSFLRPIFISVPLSLVFVFVADVSGAHKH
jgi:hypothetical protein